ncbi:uncharacterized protein [Lolium perenne]|uniref:uncharacterized protein n=1 Tax=Lolium perenne TaxID=4522 RepID=UPI0021F5789B|nr:uncharacterized protein LOC127313500 isoform X2 [Lolium perenne]
MGYSTMSLMLLGCGRHQVQGAVGFSADGDGLPPQRTRPTDILAGSLPALSDGGWTITGTTFDLRDPRILVVAQNHIMEAEYDDYSATNASTAAFCRSAALLLMALLLLRHALTLTDEDDDDTSAMFSLFLLLLTS